MIYTFVTHPWVVRLVSSVFADKIPCLSGIVYVPTHAPDKIKAGIFWGIYDYQERLLISKYLLRNCDVIELGASLGIVSRSILRRLDSDRKLISIEANQTLKEYWLKNTAGSSNYSASAILENALVSYCDLDGFDFGQDNLTGRSSSSGTSMPIITLQEISKRFSLKEPFSLVMDVEGMEYEILRHEMPFIRRCIFLCTEFHRSREQNLYFFNEMNRWGFQLLERRHTVAAWQKSVD